MEGETLNGKAALESTLASPHSAAAPEQPASFY